VVDAARVTDLLGGDVVERADQDAFAGDLSVFAFEHGPLQAGHAEVEELDRAAFEERGGAARAEQVLRLGAAAVAVGGFDEQVGGLDVAVDQAALVSVLQAQRCLADVVAGLGHGQATRLLHEPAEVDAVDALHREEVGVADLPGVVHGDDVGVGQLGGGFGLAAESLEHALVGRVFVADELERDRAPQPVVAGLEDLAHAAGAEFVQNPVRSDAQLPGLALEELVGLIRGEPALEHELPGELARVGEALLGRAG
jgi:hypothetical protein